MVYTIFLSWLIILKTINNRWTNHSNHDIINLQERCTRVVHQYSFSSKEASCKLPLTLHTFTFSTYTIITIQFRRGAEIILYQAKGVTSGLSFLLLIFLHLYNRTKLEPHTYNHHIGDRKRVPKKSPTDR